MAWLVEKMDKDVLTGTQLAYQTTLCNNNGKAILDNPLRICSLHLFPGTGIAFHLHDKDQNPTRGNWEIYLSLQKINVNGKWGRFHFCKDAGHSVDAFENHGVSILSIKPRIR